MLAPLARDNPTCAGSDQSHLGGDVGPGMLRNRGVNGTGLPRKLVACPGQPNSTGGRGFHRIHAPFVGADPTDSPSALTAYTTNR